MADTHDSTFSVIVLGFSRQIGDDALPQSLSQAFGISVSDARVLIERAPVRVKRGVDAATAKRLVGRLLGVGASLSIKNEQTGDEKIYSPGGVQGVHPPELGRALERQR